MFNIDHEDVRVLNHPINIIIFFFVKINSNNPILLFIVDVYSRIHSMP